MEGRKGDYPTQRGIQRRKGDGDGRRATARPVSTSPCVVEKTGRSALVALSPTRGRSSCIGDEESLVPEQIESFIVQKSVGRN